MTVIQFNGLFMASNATATAMKENLEILVSLGVSAFIVCIQSISIYSNQRMTLIDKITANISTLQISMQFTLTQQYQRAKKRAECAAIDMSDSTVDVVVDGCPHPRAMRKYSTKNFFFHFFPTQKNSQKSQATK